MKVLEEVFSGILSNYTKINVVMDSENSEKTTLLLKVLEECKNKQIPVEYVDLSAMNFNSIENLIQSIAIAFVSLLDNIGFKENKRHVIDK